MILNISSICFNFLLVVVLNVLVSLMIINIVIIKDK